MKISKIFTESKCPYCKYENRYTFNIEDYDTNTIIWCNKNMGGCGRAYIIHTDYEIIIPCQVYKIDDKCELAMPL